MRKFLRPLVTLLLVASLAGCSRGRLAFLERFRPAHGAAERQAPRSAVYKVKVARKGADADDLHTLGGSRRFLRRGEPIGFRTAPGGAVVAVAGSEAFPLRTLPRDLFYVWAYKVETHDADEQERRTESFLASLWNVTVVAGFIAGLAWTFPAWLFPSDSDRED